MAGLHLLGSDADDLLIVSALVQDAAVPVRATAYDSLGRQFLLTGSRFRWEAGRSSRICFGLRLGSVLRVERRLWPRRPSAMLSLLALRQQDDGRLELDFSGGAAVRLTVEAIDVQLDDLGEPWSARLMPRH